MISCRICSKNCEIFKFHNIYYSCNRCKYEIAFDENEKLVFEKVLIKNILCLCDFVKNKISFISRERDEFILNIKLTKSLSIQELTKFVDDYLKTVIMQ